MDGIRILKHAILQITGNFAVVIRLSAVLLVAHLGLNLWIVSQIYLVSNTGVVNGPLQPSILVPVIFLVLGVVYLWVAVAWHRFILLNEVPAGFIPRMHPKKMMQYVGAAILISIFLVLPLAAILLLAALVLNALPTAIGTMIGLIAILLTYYIGFRLSPYLPAKAVGSDISLGEVWGKTSVSVWTMIVLGLFSLVASLGNSVILQLLLTTGPAAYFVWSALATWISVIFGVSILSTLYGHYIEGRPLA